MKKLLFSLGVTKGGTTWLHTALGKHPAIAHIPRKELHYILRQYGGVDRLTDAGRLGQFANHVRRVRFAPASADQARVEGTDPAAYGSPWDAQMETDWAEGGERLGRYRGFCNQMDWYKTFLQGPVDDAWYRRLYEKVPDHQWAVDASTTSYLANADGYHAMAGFAEDTRAILLLRDPIDRLWSHIRFHAEFTNDLHNIDVWSAAALRDFAAHHNLVAGSFYGAAVENLMQSFAPEKRLILNFDDLRRRPAELFEEVQRFLDLDPIPLPERPDGEARVNVSNPVRMPRGAFAHLAEEFARDLERAQACGLEFVAPWIARARAHAGERPASDPMGLRSLARRSLRKVRMDFARRRKLSETRRVETD